MIYEGCGSVVCRSANKADLHTMYKIIRPSIQKDKDVKKLKKYLKYYITTNNTCIVEVSGIVTGFYAGKDNFIHYFINTGGVKSTVLLLYTVVCGIHNKYLESSFISFDSNDHMFKKFVTPYGKICTKQGANSYVITPEIKKYIEILKNKLK